MLAKLTRKVADAVVERVRQGVPAWTALKALGVNDATVSGWLNAPDTGRWPSGGKVDDDSLAFLREFRGRLDTALAEFEQDLISEVRAAGKVTGKSGVPEWRANAWLANNHPALRATYRQERIQVSQGGSTAIQHHHTHTLVRALDDDTLKQALAALPNPSENA